MSVTVKDCLSLPSLSLGRVIGGHRGLGSIVSSVSVLEFDYISEEPYTPNELAITAFYFIKDGIDMQVESIHVSKRAGIVAIVLFYSEVVLQGIDPRLIEAANQSNLPLILLPGDDLGLKYSDVIHDVSEAIFLEAKSENFYVKNTLDRISQMSSQKRTVENVLSIISERNRCSVVICDSHKRMLWHFFWPKGNVFNVENEIKENHDSKNYSHRFKDKSGVDLILYFVNPYTPVSKNMIADSAEILQLFSSIWNVTISFENKESIIVPLMEGNEELYTKQAHAFNIDLSQYKTLLLIGSNKDYKTLSTLFFQYDPDSISDVYENSIVCLFTSAPTGATWDLFVDELREVYSGKLYIIQDESMAEDCRRLYIEYAKSKDLIEKLFPNNQMVDHDKLRFASNCRKLINQRDKDGKYYFNLIEPILCHDDPVLITTLETYLFDADSSVMTTAEKLYVHRNTVKYRLDIVRKIYGKGLDTMPFYYDLYTAVALYRILKNDD
ncbi:MAG TPA: PucR family transcriptional regulator [Anaerovoracaceae bacterium]|nr:PucR family transcriptional regulator [Anaerovoracaceae bacterium]